MGRPRDPNAVRRQQPGDGPKPPDLRLLNKELETPAYPDDLDPTLVDLWDDYWVSDLAKATFATTDFAGLHRLFWLYSEMSRLQREVKDARYLVGSQGQTVINPAYRVLPLLMTETRLLEDRFGLSPKARAQLGLALSGVKLGRLEDLFPPLPTSDPSGILDH